MRNIVSRSFITHKHITVLAKKNNLSLQSKSFWINGMLDSIIFLKIEWE